MNEISPNKFILKHTSLDDKNYPVRDGVNRVEWDAEQIFEQIGENIMLQEYSCIDFKGLVPSKLVESIISAQAQSYMEVLMNDIN